MNAAGQPVGTHPSRWSVDELQRLHQAVRDVCASLQMTQQDLFEYNKGKKVSVGKDRNSIWFDIGQQFLHRSVESIYKKARRDYQASRCLTGTWTTDECDQLCELVEQHGPKWAMISKYLNRTPDACADKYREHGSGQYARGEWSEEERQKLKDIVEEYANKGGRQEQEETLPWTVISKRMGNRSRLFCKKQWETMQRENDDNKANNSSSLGPTPEIKRLYAALEKLYVKSDLTTMTTKDVLQALQADWDNEFSPQTRKLLKARLQDLVSGKIKVAHSQLKRRVAAAAVAMKSPPSTPIKEEHSDENDEADHRRVDSDQDDDDDSDSDGDRNIKRETTTTPIKEEESLVTIQDVSRAMRSILKSAPQHQMKQKALRRAVHAKYNIPKSSKQQVKRYMKKLVKEGSKRQQFQLHGKVVTMLGGIKEEEEVSEKDEKFRV